jgi:ketosteroid isomerase-like protein
VGNAQTLVYLFYKQLISPEETVQDAFTTIGAFTTDTSPIRLTSEQNILDFYNAFSASDFDTMQRMMHPDCVLDFPGSSFPNHIEGRKAIIELFRGVQAAMGGTLHFHNKWAIHK